MKRAHPVNNLRKISNMNASLSVNTLHLSIFKALLKRKITLETFKTLELKKRDEISP